jgi:hypothetical protein
LFFFLPFAAQIQCGFCQDGPTSSVQRPTLIVLQGDQGTAAAVVAVLQSRGSGGDPYGTVVPAEFTAMQHPPAGQQGKVCRIRQPQLGNALAEWVSVLSLFRSYKSAAACFASKVNKTLVL